MYFFLGKENFVPSQFLSCAPHWMEVSRRIFEIEEIRERHGNPVLAISKIISNIKEINY